MLVMTQLSRLLRTATAIVVIGSFVAWRPVTMACMTAMPHAVEHGAHHHDAPQPPAVPRDCCHLCLGACTAAPQLPSASTALLLHESIHCAREGSARQVAVYRSTFRGREPLIRGPVSPPVRVASRSLGCEPVAASKRLTGPGHVREGCCTQVPRMPVQERAIRPCTPLARWPS
jgi:hypothetical protein